MYYINAYAEVTVDSYEKGLLNNVNCYDYTHVSKLRTINDALNELMYSLCFSNFTIDETEGIISTYICTDVNNNQADEHQIELWKQGKYELFETRITFNVYEMTEIKSLLSCEQ